MAAAKEAMVATAAAMAAATMVGPVMARAVGSIALLKYARALPAFVRRVVGLGCAPRGTPQRLFCRTSLAM